MLTLKNTFITLYVTSEFTYHVEVLRTCLNALLYSSNEYNLYEVEFPNWFTYACSGKDLEFKTMMWCVEANLLCGIDDWLAI